MPPVAAPSQGKDIPSYNLLTANGTPVATHGSHHVVLDLQNVKSMSDAHQPIMGYDFLQHYKMSVSTRDNCLYHATSRIPGTITNDTSSKVSSLQPAGEYTQILQDLPQLTSPYKATSTRPHNIVDHIQTGQPVCSKSRRLSPEKLVAAKQEFQELLDQDIIRPLRVIGHRHSIWFPRHLHHPTNGGPVVIIANSTGSPRLTATLFHIPKISTSSSTGSRCSLRSTSSEHSTRFL
ncbi:uncharacterized protein LOC143029534 [Oratosquilla oratoria]|uniref:uncharacterized protein LOC143029534 n=1 Tax=Oratosquilla oratoria TaxID=337810 RepID=UPI003F76DDB5